MHAAVALEKYVIVWFGVSSAPEIELYDRGVKLVPKGSPVLPAGSSSVRITSSASR